MDKSYWDSIYKSKSETDVSWFQGVPKKSLELIAELNLGPNDSIIDIGGGDSHLVDHLLDCRRSSESVPRVEFWR